MWKPSQRIKYKPSSGSWPNAAEV
ncbi:uncharacterized protein METZ01_LOCUS358501, partial [marine metagenome]